MMLMGLGGFRLWGPYCLGAHGDVVTSYSWAYKPSCSLPNWPVLRTLYSEYLEGQGELASGY